MSVNHLKTWRLEFQELELQMDESHYVGTGGLPESSIKVATVITCWAISIASILNFKNNFSLPLPLYLRPLFISVCVCLSHSFSVCSHVWLLVCLTCYCWCVHATACMWSDVGGQFLSSSLFKRVTYLWLCMPGKTTHEILGLSCLPFPFLLEIAGISNVPYRVQLSKGSGNLKSG